MRRLLLVSLCLLSAVDLFAAPLSKASYRIAWKQSRDIITLRLEDIDSAAISIDVPVRLVVQSAPGKEIREKGDWKDRVDIPIAVSGFIPPLVIRTIPLWPHEVTLSATVIPAQGEKVSNQTTFTIQPPAWSAIIAGVIGGLAWGLISLLMKSGRKTTHVIGEFALSALAGCVAWAAANVDAVWKLIGINPESFQLQTYFLLGLCIAFIGVPAALNLITHRNEGSEEQAEPPLTASGVEKHVLDVLSGDAVRAPLREELQDILFSSDYLEQHPELLPGIEQQLVTAQYGALSKELADFLSPRTRDLYTASHREGMRTDLKYSLESDAYVREETTSYTYVMNERDPRPKVISYGHEQGVPLIDRARPREELMRFGVLVREFRIRLSHENLGEVLYVLESGGDGGYVLRKSEGFDDPSIVPSFDIKPQHNDSDHTLSFKLVMPVPKLFVERGCASPREEPGKRCRQRPFRSALGTYTHLPDDVLVLASSPLRSDQVSLGPAGRGARWRRAQGNRYDGWLVGPREWYLSRLVSA